MGIIDFFSRKVVKQTIIQPVKQTSFQAQYSVRAFDGEKNLGDVGPAIDYQLQHDILAVRSWQAYLESEIARTVIDRYIIWMIGKGLKLQCQPVKTILEESGINIDSERLNRTLESRFGLWSKSKNSSWNGEDTFNALQKEAIKNAFVGGDSLIVLSFDGINARVRVIDTAHLSSPAGRFDQKIRHGVEIDDNGKHVAYWIRKSGGGHDRILAFASNGIRTAFLFYGNKFRTDNDRGMPALSTSIESMKKIERYKEATLGSAEERQKIAYTIEHNDLSDGSSPLEGSTATLYNTSHDPSASRLATDSAGEKLADTIAATSTKDTYNMPIGASLKSLESKNELYFNDFYGTNANAICSSIGIPPNVAFSIYNDSFSASRAATKDFEHTLKVGREDIGENFMRYVYDFWLYTESVMNRVFIPGYLVSFTNGDWILREALTNARFSGSMFPHIDPLKEVNAERAKLGELGKNIPLTTVEKATETLEGGDADSNIEQFAEELNFANSLGLQETPPIVQPPSE